MDKMLKQIKEITQIFFLRLKNIHFLEIKFMKNLGTPLNPFQGPLRVPGPHTPLIVCDPEKRIHHKIQPTGETEKPRGS